MSVTACLHSGTGQSWDIKIGVHSKVQMSVQVGRIARN